MNTLQKWQSCNAAWRCWLPSSDGLRTPWDHRFCGSDFYIVACHQATRVSTTQYCNNQNKQSVDNDFLLPAHWEAYPCRSLESDYGSWRPAGPSVPGTAATTSNVELSLEEVLRLFMGLSVSPSWAPGSCGSTAAAPGCTNRQGEKKKPFHMLWELLVLRGTAQGSSVLRAAAPVCSVRRWERRGGRKRLSRPASVCLSARPCSPAAHLRQCGDAVTSAERGQDVFPQSWEQVGMCGDPLWLWMHFSHHLLLPRRLLGNLGISHFPVEVIALLSLTYCISQWLFLREGEEVQ